MSESGKITSARITPLPKSLLDFRLPEVWVRVENEPEVKIFEYYPDEISFVADEFLGLTLVEAWELKRKKDRAYIKS